MKENIKFLESLGFVSLNSNPNLDHFYMTKHSNDVYMDAQGGKDYIQIRLIGLKHIEDEFEIEEVNEDSLKRIKDKINEWENY